MCGIWCRITASSNGRSNHCLCTKSSPEDPSGKDAKQGEFISRRGPDETNTACFHLSSSRCGSSTPPGNDDNPVISNVTLTGSVLWTQGEAPVIQPYSSPAGGVDDDAVMLFNGDIYSFSGFDKENCSHSSTIINDGLHLFNSLKAVEGSGMCDILSSLQGPFAFLMLKKSTQKLYFARDFFGRESLLFSYDDFAEAGGSVSCWNISSVSVYQNVCEIATFGLYEICLKSRSLKVYPFSHNRTNVTEQFETLVDTMKKSLFIQTFTICDTMMIHPHFSTTLKKPPDSVNSEETNLSEILKLAALSKGPEDFISRCTTLISENVKTFLHFMRQSMKRRVETHPPYCKFCIWKYLNGEEIECRHSKVGVLFSGGLDSTVIAYLAAEALPPNSTLDLINVGFSKTDDFSNIPDRQTALECYEMLKERFEPEGKQINLVLVDIKKEEVAEWRKERVKHLVAPLTSVLDDSLGMCLWFAARGRGRLHPHEPGTYDLYSSPARILFLGSGADELLGGYSRHRSAYERGGWQALCSEMQLEVDRISIRNLGRDNRIVSDHGVCPRMPFLDENLVHYLVTECDLWVKCCVVSNQEPLGSRGCGEKLLLRVVGGYLFGDKYLHLALFPKRAMQFGSRIAKLEDGKEKGGDRCARLL